MIDFVFKLLCYGWKSKSFLSQIYVEYYGWGRLSHMFQSDPSPPLLTPFIRLTWYLAHIMSFFCTSN